MFDLTTDMDHLTTEEVPLYCKKLYDIVKHEFKKYPVQSVWLADLLSLQRLYNTYEFLQKKQGKEERELYKSLLDILWNIAAGRKDKAKELDQYEDLEEIAELLACGTKEDLMEDYIRPFSEKYFPDLIRNTEMDIGVLEQNFITYCSDLMRDMKAFFASDSSSSCSSPAVFNELLDLAYNITADFCIERNQDIASSPYFLEEVKNCRRDCLIACEKPISAGSQSVMELRTRYLSEFFMGALYKSNLREE